MAPTSATVIARSDPQADLRPFIERLWLSRPAMCRSVFTDLFPRGDNGHANKAQEDAFILCYFDNIQLQEHGGRFLKQVLYSIALYNDKRVNDFADEWSKRNNDLLEDEGIAKQICESVSIRTFFDSCDVEEFNHDEPFLTRVMITVQQRLVSKKIAHTAIQDPIIAHRSVAGHDSHAKQSEQEAPTVLADLPPTELSRSPSLAGSVRSQMTTTSQEPQRHVSDQLAVQPTAAKLKAEITRTYHLANPRRSSQPTPHNGPPNVYHASALRYPPQHNHAFYGFVGPRPGVGGSNPFDAHYQLPHQLKPNDQPYVLGLNLAHQQQPPYATVRGRGTGVPVRGRRDSFSRHVFDPNSFERSTAIQFATGNQQRHPSAYDPYRGGRGKENIPEFETMHTMQVYGPIHNSPRRSNRVAAGLLLGDQSLLPRQRPREPIQAGGDGRPDFTVTKFYIGKCRTDVDHLVLVNLPADVTANEIMQFVESLVPEAYCQLALKADLPGLAFITLHPFDAIKKLLELNVTHPQIRGNPIRIEVPRRYWDNPTNFVRSGNGQVTRNLDSWPASRQCTTLPRSSTNPFPRDEPSPARWSRPLHAPPASAAAESGLVGQCGLQSEAPSSQYHDLHIVPKADSAAYLNATESSDINGQDVPRSVVKKKSSNKKNGKKAQKSAEACAHNVIPGVESSPIASSDEQEEPKKLAVTVSPDPCDWPLVQPPPPEIADHSEQQVRSPSSGSVDQESPGKRRGDTVRQRHESLPNSSSPGPDELKSLNDETEATAEAIAFKPSLVPSKESHRNFKMTSSEERALPEVDPTTEPCEKALDKEQSLTLMNQPHMIEEIVVDDSCLTNRNVVSGGLLGMDDQTSNQSILKSESQKTQGQSESPPQATKLQVTSPHSQAEQDHKLKPRIPSTTSSQPASVAKKATLKVGPKQTESLSPFARQASLKKKDTKSKSTKNKKGKAPETIPAGPSLAKRQELVTPESRPLPLAEMFIRSPNCDPPGTDKKLRLKNYKSPSPARSSANNSPTKRAKEAFSFLPSAISRIAGAFGRQSTQESEMDLQEPVPRPKSPIEDNLLPGASNFDLGEAVKSDQSEPLPAILRQASCIDSGFSQTKLSHGEQMGSNQIPEFRIEHKETSVPGIDLPASEDVVTGLGVTEAQPLQMTQIRPLTHGVLSDDDHDTSSTETLTRTTPSGSSTDSGERSLRLKLPAVRGESGVVQAPVNKLVARKKKSIKLTSESESSSKVRKGCKIEAGDIIDMTNKDDRRWTRTSLGIYTLKPLEGSNSNSTRVLRLENFTPSSPIKRSLEEDPSKLDPEKWEEPEPPTADNKLAISSSQLKMAEMEHQEETWRCRRDKDKAGEAREEERWLNTLEQYRRRDEPQLAFTVLEDDD